MGAIVPTALLLLRQALDFTYKEELLMNTLSDYVEHVRTWVEEVPAAEQDAFSGGGRDHAGDHTGSYGIEERMEERRKEKNNVVNKKNKQIRIK